MAETLTQINAVTDYVLNKCLGSLAMSVDSVGRGIMVGSLSVESDNTVQLRLTYS